jgi:hypothetical protein
MLSAAFGESSYLVEQAANDDNVRAGTDYGGPV